MPKPSEFRTPGKQFHAFMGEVQSELNAATSNVTYTTVQSVFTVFRRRLSLKEGIDFAASLPPVLCALFVKDWDTDAPNTSFGSMSEMNSEVKTIRASHNFSPDNSIEMVASVLLRHVDRRDFCKAVEKISPEAQKFWGL